MKHNPQKRLITSIKSNWEWFLPTQQAWFKIPTTNILFGDLDYPKTTFVHDMDYGNCAKVQAQTSKSLEEKGSFRQTLDNELYNSK